jgi:hypothetical protein
MRQFSLLGVFLALVAAAAALSGSGGLPEHLDLSTPDPRIIQNLYYQFRFSSQIDHMFRRNAANDSATTFPNAI